MYDRIPSPGKENRVSITQDNGQVITGVLAYADDATQEGSAYTKGNVLPDSVLSLIGLPTDPSEPADMFNVLATVGDLYVWRRTTSSGTDYPVSVNPNAYQTGSDAQPAGYTLGEVVEGVFNLNISNGSVSYSYGSSVSVSDDGTVSIEKEGTVSISNYIHAGPIKGKFIAARGSSSTTGKVGFFKKNVVYFIPQDAEFSATANVDKYQTVIGYPAIPASTTIEYLGKLGDKARIVTGSYVGTGTYGQSNPNKLTFDSPPKVLFISPASTSVGSLCIITPLGQFSPVIDAFNSTSSNGRVIGVSSSFSENSVSWYNTGDASFQLNSNGFTYNYKAIL